LKKSKFLKLSFTAEIVLSLYCRRATQRLQNRNQPTVNIQEKKAPPCCAVLRFRPIIKRPSLEIHWNSSVNLEHLFYEFTSHYITMREINNQNGSMQRLSIVTGANSGIGEQVNAFLWGTSMQMNDAMDENFGQVVY
jgi:hypothetical protein